MESLFLNYEKKEGEACVNERNHNAALPCAVYTTWVQI